MASKRSEQLSKQRQIYEKDLDDLEHQIAICQPFPPVNLLRQKEFFEDKIRECDSAIGGTREQTALNAGDHFLKEMAPFIKELVGRFQTHFNRPNEEKISAYLKQFKTNRRIALALQLIQKIYFVDDAKIGDIFREFYFQKLSPDLRKKAVFTGLGGPKDSSYLINYLCSKALDEKEKREIRFQEIKDICRARASNDTVVIFLDDNIGSGKQSVRIFEEWVGLAKGEHHYVGRLKDDEINWLRGSKLMYFVLIGFEEGMNSLRKELGRYGFSIEIQPAVRTREDEHCFDATSPVFTNAIDRVDACEMTRTIGYDLLKDKKWSDPLRKERSLGYGNSQKLIVFAYNTPTCTLPILWKHGFYDGREWMPLFPRRG